MFKTILYPIDVENINDKEMHNIVRNQAKTHNSELHLMTVIPEHGFQNLITNLSAKGETELMKMYKNTLKKVIVSDFSEEHNIIVSKNLIIKCGNIYKNIVDTVKDLEIDLVMLPAHKPGLEEYLLGPNAAKVVRHAPCSVFIIRRY